MDVQQENRHTLSAAGLFAEFERDGFTLRNPVSEVVGLYKTVAVGDCLEPLITAHDVLYIDQEATPVHGDIVMFRWSQEVQDSWNSSERKAEWMRRFGVADFSRGMKLLWRWPQGVPAQYQDTWLIANDGMRKLEDGHTVLGVLRAIDRKGVRLTGDLVHRKLPAASIDPDAVSQIASAFGTGSSGNNINAANSPVTLTLQSVAVICTGVPIAIDWSINYRSGTSAGGTVTDLSFGIYRDGTILSSGQGQFDDSAPGSSTSFILATSTLTDSPSAGSHTYALKVVATGTGTGTGVPINSGKFDYTNAFLKVREIKK